jgi:two-component system, NarL family, sensor histidine kinase DevS
VDAETGASLRFPDLPKLELDDLIDELVARAQDVKRTQGRLRALVHAIETVSSDLALESVLRNVVEAACELSGARYGALGVIGYDGGLEQFIHVGMNSETVARIGQLPQGLGLLGALIARPDPIRLKHMSDDDRSVGFPDEHPPMDSFLGVPIRVRGAVFGNLYLTDSRHGSFSDEDEKLVAALALAAGTAVSHGRLYQESRLQQRWLSASVEISSQLLSAMGEDPLRMIARHAIEIADADLVTVGLLTPDGLDLMVDVATGEGADALLGQRFYLANTLAGRAVEDDVPLLLSADDNVERRSHEATVMDAGPLMVVPLRGSHGVRGVLSLVRARGRQPFSGADLNMAAGFANHASVALELADSRTLGQQMVLLKDRERIARDLHDHVIQELFAIGLGLESAALVLGPDEPVAQRIAQRVTDLDRTIRQIRTSIFELRGSLAASSGGVRQRVLGIVADLTPVLGFAARVAFSGLVDIAVSAGLADEIAAVVREALTNIAKHACATCVSVDVTATDTDLALCVIDDGVGIAEDASTDGGLANLRSRAELLGGTFEARARTDASAGTVLLWKVPLS